MLFTCSGWGICDTGLFVQSHRGLHLKSTTWSGVRHMIPMFRCVYKYWKLCPHSTNCQQDPEYQKHENRIEWLWLWQSEKATVFIVRISSFVFIEYIITQTSDCYAISANIHVRYSVQLILSDLHWYYQYVYTGIIYLSIYI